MSVDPEAAHRIQRIVGAVEREAGEQGRDVQMQPLAHRGSLGVDRRLLLGRRIVERRAQAEEGGLAVVPLDVGAHPTTEIVVGRRPIGQETAADLQDLVGAQEVRQVEFEVELLLDIVEPAGENQRVGAAQAIVERIASIHPRALGGRISGADLQRARLAVVEPDQDRAPRLACSRGRQGHRHAVVDVGVDQPLFQLGDLDRVVDVAWLPRREAAHEIGPGPRPPAETDRAQPHEIVRGQLERRLDGLVVMVDDDGARHGLGVGVAGLVQGDHGPRLGRQDVRRPAWRPGDELQRRRGLERDGLGRRGANPFHGRRLQREARAGRDLHQRFRRRAIADVRRDLRLVIALRPQQRGDVLRRVPRASPRLGRRRRRRLDLADGGQKSVAQRSVQRPHERRARLRPPDEGRRENGRQRAKGEDEASRSAQAQGSSRSPRPALSFRRPGVILTATRARAERLRLGEGHGQIALSEEPAEMSAFEF